MITLIAFFGGIFVTAMIIYAATEARDGKDR